MATSARQAGSPSMAAAVEENRKAAPSAALSLEEAVGRLPRETVELFQERLRGQFREVRRYRPRRHEATGDNPARDPLPGMEEETDFETESD